MNYTEKGTYMYKGEEKEYHYLPTIPLSAQTKIVEAVGAGVFDNGNYFSLLKDTLFNIALVMTFTDVDMDDIANIDDFVAFDKETGISNKVKEDIHTVDYKLIEKLEKAIDDNIEYKKNVGQDNLSTVITDLLTSLEEKVKNFSLGIDKDEIEQFIEKFNNSDLTADGITKAYFDSDIYKKNVQEVADTKNKQIKELEGELEKKIKKAKAKATVNNVIADDKVVPIMPIK